MLNPKIHQLVHNFHIFVVPMASPELVYSRKNKAVVTRLIPDPLNPAGSGLGQNLKAITVEKYVRMDFGFINEHNASKANPNCFETNTALILMQMMIRNTFVAVLDLKDGEENLILYPYGYIPVSESSRILEDAKNTPSESTKKKPDSTENKPNSTPNANNPKASNPANNTQNSDTPKTNTADQKDANINQDKPEWDESDKEFWNDMNEGSELGELEDEEESETSNGKEDPETASENQKPPPLGNLEEIQWDQMDENWDDISKTINRNFWKAYFNEDQTNEDFIFKKIASILSQVGGGGTSKEMSPFLYGQSRKYDSRNEGGEHIFNMFIDFAYSASFNKYNQNILQCRTFKASNYLKYAPSRNTSFRALAFSIVLAKPSKSSSNDISYGDEKSVRFRLFKSQPQHFTIHSHERIGIEKFRFQTVKKENEHIPSGTKFDDGHYGSSSRFIVMFLSMANIVQPVLSIDHISHADNLKMEHYPTDEKKSVDSPYLKKITGDLNLRLRIRGCLGGADIWDLAGNKLKEVNSVFDETMNETLVDLVLPVQNMNNPFNTEDKSILHDKPEPNRANMPRPIDGPGISTTIPLKLRINQEVNNLLAIKLNLKCTYYEEDKKGLFSKLPQSHFTRAVIDPGYYVVNPWTQKLDYQTPTSVFQVMIQDVFKLEDSYMVQQKFLANIDVITDFDLFFNFADKASAVSVGANDIEGKRVELQPRDENTETTPKFTSSIKLFSYNTIKGQFEFSRNLQLLARNWTLDFKFFGDIGCCTTSTQGRSILMIHNKSKNPNSITPTAIFSLFANRGYNGDSMMVDINDAKKNDPYGLLFYELIGGGVSLHYRGQVPLHADSMIHSYNRQLEEVQTAPIAAPKDTPEMNSVRVDISKISQAAGYDMNNLFAFGYMTTGSPVTTPYAGVMCSDREKYYLQIVPLANPNHVDIYDDSIGNMLFKITMFSSKRAEFEIEIEGRSDIKLYFKNEIDHNGKKMYEFTNTINPHIEISSITEFTRQDRKEDEHKSTIESTESNIEEEFLNEDKDKKFSQVNFWSMLSGRKLKVRMSRQVNSSLRIVDLFFECSLRNKNPVYEEKYALMFKFNPVMKDDSYTSSKFIL